MKPTTVSYERLTKTRDYENQRYSITVELEDGEEPREAWEKCRRAVDREIALDEMPGSRESLAQLQEHLKREQSGELDFNH